MHSGVAQGRIVDRRRAGVKAVEFERSIGLYIEFASNRCYRCGRTALKRQFFALTLRTSGVRANRRAASSLAAGSVRTRPSTTACNQIKLPSYRSGTSASSCAAWILSARGARSCVAVSVAGSSADIVRRLAGRSFSANQRAARLKPDVPLS